MKKAILIVISFILAAGVPGIAYINEQGGYFGLKEGAPLAIGPHGVMYGITETYLLRSDDGWNNMEHINNFSGLNGKVTNIHALDSGTWLIATKDGKILRLNEATRSITEVLKFPYGYAHVFSINSYKQNVVVGEYGGRGLARRVYYSPDDGRTFSLIYTLPENPDHHIHAVCYDRYSGSIWFSNGDFRDQGIYVSDPSLKNFEKLLIEQPTSIVATPTHVLFGKDFGSNSPFGGDNGVLSYHRTTGTFNRVLLLKDEYNHPIFSMLYDEQNDTVFVGTVTVDRNPSETSRFALWRSVGDPYTSWEKLADMSYSDGYKGFMKLAGIKNNVLYCYVVDSEGMPRNYQIKLTKTIL